jgi:transposase
MASPRHYPEELKERAVRMVREIGERGAIKRVADQLDINPETLRNWGVSRTWKEAVCRSGL